MNILILTVIIISGITNMIADIFLSSGRKNSKQTRLDIIKNTPDKHLFISAFLGSISIGAWLVVLVYLAQLPTVLGQLTMISYALFIAFIITFHVSCSYAFYVAKHDETKYDYMKKVLGFFMGMCTLLGAIVTALLIALNVQGIISLNLWQILFLPLFATLIIQMGIGTLLKKVPYFQTIAGTLATVISIISLITVFM